MNTEEGKAETRDWNGPVQCEDIQDVLFDYMSRELGAARSDLVREHLRKCENCQAVAQEVQSTLDLLHSASRLDAGDKRLTDDRHRRVLRALTHPVIHWIERHHILVSFAVAGLVLLAVLVVLKRARIWETDEFQPGPAIMIGTNQPPASNAVHTVEQPPDVSGWRERRYE